MAVVPATALIPVPEKLTLRSGSFALGAATSIVADADLRVAAELLRDQLRPATGFPLAVVSSAKGSRIALSLDPAVGSLGDEGYRLAVTADEVRIRAPKPAGILHGSQTLRQLFPSDIFRRAPVAGASWTIPAEATRSPRMKPSACTATHTRPTPIRDILSGTAIEW